MRKWIPFVGLLVLSFPMVAQTPSEILVQQDLEKTRNMTADESFAYMRRTYTMRAMEVLAKMLEAWRLAHGRYPAGSSIDALRGALAEMFDAEKIPTNDRWGSDLRYIAAPDGKQYRVISAGGDRMFDERSWTKPGDLATDDDDAVLAGGKFVRQWTDATKPGLGPRGRLTPAARELLAKADAQMEADNRSGALAAYIDAVKADARAADLEAIRRYAPASFLALPPPPPPPARPARGAAAPRPPAPPPPPPPDAPSPDAALHVAALRQYLDLHPGDAEATRDLIGILPAAEALTLADAYVAKRSADPEAYDLRGMTRIGAGRAREALTDFEKAASLDASNPQRQYKLGVSAFEVATKTPGLDQSAMREYLRRSKAALERAGSLQSDYREALVYRSLVLRKMSELETDAAARQKLATEADAVRSRAMDLMKRGSERKP